MQPTLKVLKTRAMMTTTMITPSQFGRNQPTFRKVISYTSNKNSSIKKFRNLTGHCLILKWLARNKIYSLKVLVVLGRNSQFSRINQRLIQNPLTSSPI